MEAVEAIARAIADVADDPDVTSEDLDVVADDVTYNEAARRALASVRAAVATAHEQGDGEFREWQSAMLGFIDRGFQREWPEQPTALKPHPPGPPAPGEPNTTVLCFNERHDDCKNPGCECPCHKREG